MVRLKPDTTSDRSVAHSGSCCEFFAVRLLDDFDGEVRRLCGFLGLDWDPAMRDFAAAARKRDIKTPSGLQVKRGLNTDGAGQWQRYRTHLEPVLPVLAPWVKRFGYQ